MPSGDPIDAALAQLHIVDAGPARPSAPGSATVVTIDSGTLRGEASVYLIVKDTRLQSVERLSKRQVRRMIAGGVDVGQATPLRTPDQTQADLPLQQSCLLEIAEGLSVLLTGFFVGAVLTLKFLGHLPGFNFGAQELIILLILAVLLFGRKLPECGRYQNKGIVEFNKGVKGLEDEEAAPLDKPSTNAKKSTIRRATVRYYNRMNPERIYPLLVMITRDMVEKVHKKHTDQRTSTPFAVDVDTPVEIEPVLPGCDCYPPKMLTRLDEGDKTLTFRVAPRVMGRVEGAVVSIRQDHGSLAEVELDVKVVKRTLAAACGAATFLLPGLSAVMKHFGLDFETQKGQGFNLYLSVARLMFDNVSPMALTALLGVATALLWWLTRPRTRDVFWDVEKVSSEKPSVCGRVAGREDHPPSRCQASPGSLC